MMERIVGNVLMFVFFFFNYASGEIILRITDEDGAQLERVGVGRPFILQAELKNLYKGIQEPKIEHLDRYEHYRSGVQMTTVNGATSAIYTYRCRIDQIGNHVLGPAVIPGTREKSLPLSFVVTDEPQYTKQPKKESTSTFFRITANLDRVVVGQKIKINAKFYTNDTRIQLQNMIIPNLSAFRVVEKRGPAYGQEKINGMRYEYTEWEIELYAQEPGEQCIPAFSAEYEYPSQSKYALFSWGHFGQTKRVYSNSLRIAVETLPGTQTVDFIGSHASYHAVLSQPQAKFGEGAVYTLSLSGDGDLETVSVPEIKGVPEGLRIYPSKHSIVPETDDCFAQKQFEFVVQGVKEGSWEIPAQQLSIFDVSDRAYKTIQTLPVRIMIKGGSPALSIPSVVDEQEDEMISQTEELVDVIRPLNQQDPWYPTSERASLNWTLFFMLVFAPCAYGISEIVKGKVAAKMNPKRQIKKAFQEAYSALDRAQKEKKYAEIYHVYLSLFSELFQMNRAQISGEYSTHKLRDTGASPEMIREWQKFFEKITECAFGWQIRADDAYLWHDARMWLEKWKELV